MGSVKLVGILVLCIVIAAPITAQATILCEQVSAALYRCQTYLAGASRMPPQPCCNGVRKINSAARTTSDRQKACSCLKQAAQVLIVAKKFILAKAQNLPRICKVKIPYTISMNINCNNVK